MPNYLHDCEKCIGLGDCKYKDQVYDLYFCTQGGLFHTVIARYGEESEYMSGLAIAKWELEHNTIELTPLATALLRAREVGLLPEN